ncbi:MAG: VWA domain-containing protein [Caulobacteraceae bacterium]
MPSAPPPADGRARAAIGGVVGNYAQMAPQPMPGDIDRENYEDVDTNPIRMVATDPVSTFSIDVDTASYSNVRRLLNSGRLPPQDAVRTEELVNYFRYDYPLPPTREQPFSTNVTVAPSPWAEGRQLVHIGLQGYNIVPRERPALNLTLLIDVSGSMAPENKLPLALQSFRMLIEQLNASDRVSIVVYAGAAGAVLEPTPGSERGRIIAALENLHAGGSTAAAKACVLPTRWPSRTTTAAPSIASSSPPMATSMSASTIPKSWRISSSASARRESISRCSALAEATITTC